ncbi:uncharacterized protein LOC110699854 [Chenopodium quinoa]|uniref:uncharacterized protein LOC110699854 n=1 Tax=Chenopodium quinoa TaxID=63459 RepID=UPI000B77147D|nr:uncharacterized protein LOC110699854 [Chenopodium quinoa]
MEKSKFNDGPIEVVPFMMPKLVVEDKKCQRKVLRGQKKINWNKVNQQLAKLPLERKEKERHRLEEKERQELDRWHKEEEEVAHAMEVERQRQQRVGHGYPDHDPKEDEDVPPDRFGSACTLDEVEDFGRCLRLNGLIDFKTGSLFYTWNNKQDGENKVCSNIDKVVVNGEWVDDFKHFSADFLPEGLMNHSPCCMRLFDVCGIIKKPFWFFNMWTEAPGFLDIVRNNWNRGVQGTAMFIMTQELKDLKKSLKEVNLKYFSDVESTDIAAQKELSRIQKQLNKDPRNDNLIRDELVARMRYSEAHKARYDFLKQKAKVKWLKELSVANAFVSYYKGLLGIDQGQVKDIHPTVITVGLVLPKNQKIVKDDLCNAVMDFYAQGKLLKQINTTTLTLIPKTANAVNVTQFRPIACCNVFYKITSKLICGRLKEVLPGLISDGQGAFVAGRSIMDNNMWVMVCVSSPSFSIMINGGLSGFFKGAKGIRQGDPMSPLLFVISMEYLTRLLRKIGEKKDFKFHMRCRSLKLNHLVFADDLMLFGAGNKKIIMLLVKALKMFHKVSGLQANQDKTTIYYRNFDEDLKAEILSVFGFVEGKFPFRYLGIALNSTYLRIVDFDVLVDKMMANITCWTSRSLSYAARVILINSVLISFHSYWAQCLLLPKGVIDRINKLCRAFLWDGSVSLSKAPPITWEWVWYSK